MKWLIALPMLVVFVPASLASEARTVAPTVVEPLCIAEEIHSIVVGKVSADKILLRIAVGDSYLLIEEQDRRRYRPDWILSRGGRPDTSPSRNRTVRIDAKDLEAVEEGGGRLAFGHWIGPDSFVIWRGATGTQVTRHSSGMYNLESTEGRGGPGALE